MGEAGLSAINVQSDGRLVAVGSLDGSTTLLQVCNSLAEPQNNEKQSITQMFERENKREKNLEIRAMQLRREKKAAAGKEGGENATATQKKSATAVDAVKPKAKQKHDDDKEKEMLDEIEKQFYAAIGSIRQEGEAAATDAAPGEE